MLLNAVEFERLVKARFIAKKIGVFSDATDSRFELTNGLGRNSLPKFFNLMQFDTSDIPQGAIG